MTDRSIKVKLAAHDDGRAATVHVAVRGAWYPTHVHGYGASDADALAHLWRKLAAVTAAVVEAGKLARKMDER